MHSSASPHPPPCLPLLLQRRQQRFPTSRVLRLPSLPACPPSCLPPPVRLLLCRAQSPQPMCSPGAPLRRASPPARANRHDVNHVARPLLLLALRSLLPASHVLHGAARVPNLRDEQAAAGSLRGECAQPGQPLRLGPGPLQSICAARFAATPRRLEDREVGEGHTSRPASLFFSGIRVSSQDFSGGVVGYYSCLAATPPINTQTHARTRQLRELEEATWPNMLPMVGAEEQKCPRKAVATFCPLVLLWTI